MAYLAGDSRVCDQFLAPWTGWGQILTASVRRGAVVANYADSGESSGSQPGSATDLGGPEARRTNWPSNGCVAATAGPTDAAAA